MINDHLTGTSSSLHGSSRVTASVSESHERSIKQDFSESALEAVAISPAAVAGECCDKPTSAKPHVLVLMCTYNGQNFLEQQLESIKSQTVDDWHVAISDDGSEDATCMIANRYRALWGEDKVSVWRGPGRGFARNFISNVCNTVLNADFYAWCDQDDVWESGKLRAALDWLERGPQDVPALYFGRTRLVSESDEFLGYSPLFRRPPTFANALVQSIGGGNTMVFNHAARLLLQETGEGLDIVSHDWWAYLLVSGAGGRLFYDARPYVHYRQHINNLVGSNAGWRARYIRLRMMFEGRFKHWNSTNIAGLETVKYRLTDENLQVFEHFKALRSEAFFGRLKHLKRSGVYRQTLLGNLGLMMATVIRKV